MSDMITLTPPATGRYVATGLKTFLDQRGIMGSWLARRIGVSRPHLVRIYYRQRTVPPHLAARIAEVLAVPMEMIFEPVDGREKEDCLPNTS